MKYELGIRSYFNFPHPLVGAPCGCPFGSTGVVGVTLRLGVQTARRNRSVACDDCRFIGTMEYTAAYPMVSSELQNSKMRLAAISVPTSAVIREICGKNNNYH